MLALLRHFPRTLVFAAVLLTPSLHALDWPQFRGPSRDDVSRETGLLKAWPEGGPKRVWLFDKAGSGYAGFSVVDGKLYTLGTRDNQEILLALDVATGRELWATPLGEVLQNNWGNGPRSTPTVAGDHLYAMTGPGKLVCALAKTGKIVWEHAMAELGGKIPGWGYTESPLVDGEQVVCTPGGPKGTMAAFDRLTGKLRWQSDAWTDPAQYSSIVKASINGKAQYIQLTAPAFAGIDPLNGAVRWREPWIGKTAVIPTPIVHENQVFITSGYGAGCKLVKIGPNNESTLVYENKVMKNHHGGVLLYEGNLFGYSDGLGWVCMEFATGNQLWAERSKLGKGAVSCAEGMLYCLDEGKGTVALAEASPKGWTEHGRLTLDPQSAIRSPQGRIWTHPVIANGRLYLRDQEYIYAYEIKAK